MGLINPYRNNIFNTPYSELHSQQEEPPSVDDFYGQYYDDFYQQPDVQPDVFQQQQALPSVPAVDADNEFIRFNLLKMSKSSVPKVDTDFEDTISRNANAEAQEERPVTDDWRDWSDSQGRVKGKRNPKTIPRAGEFTDKFHLETENLVTSQDWNAYIQNKERQLQGDLSVGNVEEHNVWEQLLKERAHRYRSEAQKKESWGPEKSAEYDARKLEQKEKTKAGYAAAKDGLLLGIHLQTKKKTDWGNVIGRVALTAAGIPTMPTDDRSVLQRHLKQRYPNLDARQLEAVVDQSLTNAKVWEAIKDGATSDADKLLDLMNRKVSVFERQPGLVEVDLAPWDKMLAARQGKKTTKTIEDPEQKEQFAQEQAAWTAEHSATFDSLENKINRAERFADKLQKTIGSVQINGRDIDLKSYFVSQIEAEKLRYQEVVDKQQADDNALYIMKQLKESKEAHARELGIKKGSAKWDSYTRVDRNDIYEWKNNLTNALKNSYEDSLAVRYTPIRLIQRSVSKFVLEATSLGFMSMEQAFDEQRYGPSMDWYSADAVKKIIGASERAMHKAAQEDLGETGAWVEGVFAEVAPQLLRMAVVRNAFKMLGVSGAIPFTASVSWGGSQEAMNALREQAELGVPKDKMGPAAMLMFAAEVIPEAILYRAGAGVARQIFNPAQYSNWMRGLGSSFMVAAKNAPAELVQEWITTFMQQHIRANFGIDRNATSPEQMYAALKRTFWVSLGMSFGGGVTSATDALSLVNQLRKMDHITPEMYEEFVKSFRENKEKRQGFGVVDALDKAHDFVAMFRADAHRLLELGPDRATTRKNWEEHGPGEQDKDGKPIRANTEKRKQMFDWIATAVAELEDTAESVQQEKEALEEQKPVQDFEVSAINRETGEETTITVPAKNIEDAEESVTGYKTPDGDQLFDPATKQEAPVEEAETDSLMEQTQDMLATDELVEPVAQESVEIPQEPQVDPVREEVSGRVDSKGMGAIDAAAELDPSGTLMDRINQEVPTEAPTEAAEGGQTVYRAEKVGQKDDGLGVAFYTEDKTYADLYKSEDREIKEAQIPENLVDIRQADGRNLVKQWAKKKIAELEKQGRSNEFLAEAKKALTEDSPEATSRLLANLTLSINKQAGRGLGPPGVAERQFLTETGNEAMTVKEGGRAKDEYSYAIIPTKVKVKDAPTPTEAAKEPTLSEKIIAIGKEVNDAVADPNAKQFPNVFAQFAEILPEVNAELADEIAKVMGAESFAAIPEDTLRAVQADVQKFLETGKAPSSAMAQLFVVYRDFINKTISTPGQVPPKKIQELLNAEVTVAPIQEKELNDVLDKYSDSDLVRLAQRMKIDVTDKSVSQIRDEISDVVATEVYLEDATNRLELSDQTAERKQQVETAKDSVRKAYEDLTKLGAKYDPKEQAEKELKLASAIYDYLYAKVKDTGVTVLQASAKMFSDLGITITKDNYASVQKILNEQVSKVQEDYFKVNPEEKPLTEKELKGLEAPTYKGAAFLADHINKGTPATVEQFYSHMEKNMAAWTAKDDQGKPLMSAAQKVKAWYDALVLSTYATTEAPAAGQQEGKGLTEQQIKQRSLMRYMFTKMQQAKTPQEAKRLIDAMRGVGSRYQKTVDAVVRRLEKANEKYELLKSQNKLSKLSQKRRTQELDEIKKEWLAITRELQSDVSKKDWITKLNQKELAGEFKSHEEMLAAAFKLQGVIKEVSRKQAIKKLKKTLSNFNKRSQLPYFEQKFADLIKDIDANLLDPNMSAKEQDKKLRSIIFGDLLPEAVEGVKLQTTRDGKTVEVLLSEIGDKPSPEQVTSIMKALATAPASMFGLPAETVKSLQDTAKLLSRKNVNNLTEEEADSVRASVVGFIHQNKIYKGYFKKQSNADIQAKALESAKEIFKILTPAPVTQGPQVTKPGRVHSKLKPTLGLAKDILTTFWSTPSLATPETMATIISGGENTATHKILYGNLADAAKAQSQTLYDNQQFLVHALKQAGIDLNDPAQAKEFLKLSSVYAEDEALNETLRKMTVVSEKKPAITEVFSLSTKTVPVKQTGTRKAIEGVDGVALQSEMSLTPMQIAGLIVQFRDPHWRKLIAVDNKDNPNGWTPLQFRQGGEKYYLSNKDIEAILNYDGAHSKAVHAVANAVWDQINGPMGTAVREYMLSVDGVETTREFYAPGLRVRKSQEVEVEQLTPSSLRTSQAALKQLNILKSLTQDKKSGVLIQDALHMYANHSQFTSALQHMATPLAEAAAVMDMLSGKQEIVAGTKGISGFLGKGLWQAPNGIKVIKYYETLLNSLTSQAMGRKGTDVGAINRAASQIARNLTIGGLGLNPRVWMYQVTSLSTASSEIEWKYIAKALKGGRKLSWVEAARSGITGEQKRHTTQDEINFWSTLRDRSTGQRFGLVSEGLSDSTQHPLIHKKTLSDKFMAGIGGMDAVTIRTIWEAAKLELNDKINDPNYKGKLKIPADWQSEPAYWKALDKRAQQIVDRTQPSMDLMHLSGLARESRQGNSAARMVTMFMAQRMKNVNLGLRAVHDFRQGNFKGAANKAASVLFYQTVGIAAIKEVYDYGSQSIWGMVAKGLTGLPEEPKDPIKPAAEYMDYIISSWFSNLPLGQFPGYLAQQAFKTATGHKGRVYTPPLSPVLSSIDSLANNKLSSPKQLRRFLLDAMSVSGAPVHFAREFNKAYNRRETYTKIISRRNRALNKEIKEKYKGDHNLLPSEQRKEYNALTKPLSYRKGGEKKTTTYAKRIDQLNKEANALEKMAKESLSLRAKELNRQAQNIRNEADKLAGEVFKAVFE